MHALKISLRCVYGSDIYIYIYFWSRFYSKNNKYIFKLENAKAMIVKTWSSTNLCNNSSPENLDFGGVDGRFTGFSIVDRL